MTARKAISMLHRYTGLAVGLLLVLSGLSGSLLVFREEIETLIHPEWMRTVPREERVSLQSVLETVQHAYPKDRPLFIRIPRTPQQTYLIKLNNAHDLFIYVDPYTGKILGEHRQEDTVTGWIALLHTELLSGETGEIILGFGALLLVGMCISGVILWWPRNRKFLPGLRVQWSAPWKKVNFDVHRASGIYAGFFILFTAITAASLVFDKTAASMLNAITQSQPRPAPPVSHPRQAGGSLPSLDRMLHQADKILPAVTTWIGLPRNAEAPMVVRKKYAGEWHPNGRNFIYMDQYSGKVLQVENVLTSPVGTRILNTFYPIHIGVIGGTTTRIIQLIIGMIPLILLFTGGIMWWNRRKLLQTQLPRKSSVIH